MLQVSSAANVFSLEGFCDIFLSPLLHFHSACPQILCQTTLNQVAFLCMCMCARSPLSVFTEPLFMLGKGFFNLGQQAAVAEAAGAESERARQPSRQSVAAVEPQQLPGGAHYTGEISNHESFTPVLPPPLPSPTIARCLDARPAACLPLSASLMNDYCVS